MSSWQRGFVYDSGRSFVVCQLACRCRLGSFGSFRGPDHDLSLCVHLSGCRCVVGFIPWWPDDGSDDDSHDLEVFAGRIDANRFVLGVCALGL